MRWFYLLCLLAACGDPGARTDEILAGRRVALGLGGEPLPFAEAMEAMEKGAFEGLLTRVGSRRLPADEVLDAALRIEDLLARADPASAAARARAPAEFDDRLRQSREDALALARAVAAGERGTEIASVLITSCLGCHETFRKRR